MTITTDVEQLTHEKDVAELAIKIRADMEYTLRVLKEQIGTIEVSISSVDFSAIPLDIQKEGADILEDLKTLRNHLDSNHSEFLIIP